MNERATETYNEQCRGICAFESSAAALPFASQTLRSRLGSTSVSSSNGRWRRSNDCILRGKVWRFSVGMSACCILGRLNVCIIDILMTDRGAVDRQSVDVEAGRERLVQGPESSNCRCEKSFLVHLVRQARTGSATCSFVVLHRCQWFSRNRQCRQDLPLGRTLRRLCFAASKIHLQVPRGRQSVFLTSCGWDVLQGQDQRFVVADVLLERSIQKLNSGQNETVCVFGGWLVVPSWHVPTPDVVDNRVKVTLKTTVLLTRTSVTTSNTFSHHKPTAQDATQEEDHRQDQAKSNSQPAQKERPGNHRQAPDDSTQT